MVERTFVSALSRPLGDGSPSALAPSPSRGATAARRDATNPPDDATLVAGVLAGDRAGEEALYRRHAPSVLRLATRLLRSNEDASDVLQDAFVTAFEDLGALREPDAFRAWVHRITVRLVHRRFRRRRLLGLLGLDKKNGEVSLESLADESASQEARVELRWLDAALARIDGNERIAWMLRHVEGLALEEVAVTCDCSLATAKRRIAAAEVVVRRHLEGGDS
jgi:RNA polymerase sigma-70 factor, ECF subfamily